MPTTLPSVATGFVRARRRGDPVILAMWPRSGGRSVLQSRGDVVKPLSVLLVAAAWLVACHRDPPVAPGTPIPAAPEVALGTMDAECEGLLAALGGYKECSNLDEDDKLDVDAWIERAQEDFAAGKKVSPEPNAQRAIAAACHKATVSVKAANERCLNGPKPQM
jgi:hypothetical protein